ncbi:hypothetical protein LX32DRAFT_217452 [Colletotrichum zoysiae]|uniref:Uncharacterized protein n=1 Tax=Colletotrichum zoysiae TaxID=1216348 RepID=A0AAD9M512_9PEZI|nr:hypothetical protein LX32DRAFT_217452 [Colletotrichum zoysiae]
MIWALGHLLRIQATSIRNLTPLVRPLEAVVAFGSDGQRDLATSKSRPVSARAAKQLISAHKAIFVLDSLPLIHRSSSLQRARFDTALGLQGVAAQVDDPTANCLQRHPLSVRRVMPQCQSRERVAGNQGTPSMTVTGSSGSTVAARDGWPMTQRHTAELDRVYADIYPLAGTPGATDVGKDDYMSWV